MQYPRPIKSRELSLLNLYRGQWKEWLPKPICRKAPYRKEIAHPMQPTHSSDLYVLPPSDSLPRIFTGGAQEED